jgi:hypothetical protein
MMDVRDLLLLPADDVPYESLDADVLLALATQEEEPSIATSALGELPRVAMPPRHAPRTRSCSRHGIGTSPHPR